MCFYYKSVLWTTCQNLQILCMSHTGKGTHKIFIRFQAASLHYFFFFQILNWFCVSASTSVIYFFQQRFCRKVLAADISGCNLFCIRQIGKYFAFLWRPSIFNTFWKNPFIKAIQADAFDTLLIPPLPDIAICHLFRSERAVPK